jgi:hypothetical protein
MTQPDLPTLVRQLHEELGRSPSLDESTRTELRDLASDLERVAGMGVGAQPSHEGLRGRLTEGVERFEASHPGVAKALANLIDALALYGL